MSPLPVACWAANTCEPRPAKPSADTTALGGALEIVGLAALPLDIPVGPGGRLLSQCSEDASPRHVRY